MWVLKQITSVTSRPVSQHGGSKHLFQWSTESKQHVTNKPDELWGQSGSEPRYDVIRASTSLGVIGNLSDILKPQHMNCVVGKKKEISWRHGVFNCTLGSVCLFVELFRLTHTHKRKKYLARFFLLRVSCIFCFFLVSFILIVLYYTSLAL